MQFQKFFYYTILSHEFSRPKVYMNLAAVNIRLGPVVHNWITSYLVVLVDNRAPTMFGSLNCSPIMANNRFSHFSLKLLYLDWLILMNYCPPPWSKSSQSGLCPTLKRPTLSSLGRSDALCICTYTFQKSSIVLIESHAPIGLITSL